MYTSLTRRFWLCSLLLVEACLLFSSPLLAGNQKLQPQYGVRSEILSALNKQAGLKVGFTETFDSVRRVYDRPPMKINNISYQIRGGLYDTRFCDHCGFCVLKDFKCVRSPKYNGKALVSAEGKRTLSITNIYGLRGRIISGIGVSVMDAGGLVPRTITVTTKTANSSTKYEFPVKDYPPHNLDDSLDAGTYAFIPQPLFLESIDIYCDGVGACVYSTVDYFFEELSQKQARAKVMQTAKAGKMLVKSASSPNGLPLQMTYTSGFTALGLGITCKSLDQKPYEAILLSLTNAAGGDTSENLRTYFSDEEYAKGIYGWFGYPESYTALSLQVPDAGCELNIVDVFVQ